ncbi:MAG: acyltransferase [Butyrivibrio sp.]|nr:acyltransferase [Butyrivibrio sp.]
MESLQVIRALAFLGIFLSHSGVVEFSASGTWGVSVFFILSGFLMFRSYDSTERIKHYGIQYSIKFGINKIKKLYSLHIVTMLLAMPWLVMSYIDYQSNDKILIPIFKTVMNVFLLQSWIPNDNVYFSLNGVAWYLSVSLFLYIMFPFILHFMKKYRGRDTAIATIVIMLIFQFFMALLSNYFQMNLIHDNKFVRWFVYIFPASRLEDFFIGCNLGYIFKNIHKPKFSANRKLYTFFEIIIITIIIIQMSLFVIMITIPTKVDPTNTFSCWWGYTILWTVSSCILIYLFAKRSGKISTILTNRLLVFIGNMSANAFLIHQIVFRYLELIELKIFGIKYVYANIVVCFFVTMICAYMWNKIINLFQHYKNGKQLNI